jgi:hypothetical protein
MIERPPVSENSTPTLISPAARAPVLNTHGDVTTALPASSPFFRNLRLSTAITPLPVVFRHTKPFAPKHVVSNRKVSRSDRAPDDAAAPAAILDPKNKKARQILADLPGYLARTRPATLMVRQRRERYSLQATFKS